MEIPLSSGIKLVAGWQPPEVHEGNIYRWTDSSFEVEFISTGIYISELKIFLGFAREDSRYKLQIQGNGKVIEFKLKLSEQSFLIPVKDLLCEQSGKLRFVIYDMDRNCICSHSRGVFVRAIFDNINDEVRSDRFENWLLAINESKNKIANCRSLPFTYTVDLTNICNMDCIMCTVQYPPIVQKMVLSSECVDEIIKLLPNAKRIQLHGSGESTTSKLFWHILKKLKEHKDIFSEFNTNGKLITKLYSNKIIDSGVKLVNFSIDASNTDTYNKIRNYDFDTIINNIRILNEEKENKKSNVPVVNINMTIMRENASEASEFINMAKKLNVNKVIFYHLNKLNDDLVYDKYDRQRNGWEFNYKNNLPENNMEYIYENLMKAIKKANEHNIELELDLRLKDIIEKQNIYEYTNNIAEKEIESKNGEKKNSRRASREDEVNNSLLTVKDCTNPWHWCVITVSGEMYPCCMAKNSAGRISSSVSIKDLWHGKNMRSLRKYISTGKIHFICRDAVCNYVQNQINIKDYIFPNKISDKENFYADNLWTDGEGILKKLNIHVPESAKYLIVHTYGFSRYVDDIQKLKLEVYINNTKCNYSHCEDNSFYYFIEENHRLIEDIKIKSNVFRPSDTFGTDDRLLGVDLAYLELK